MTIECNNYRDLYARGSDEYTVCREAQRSAASVGTSPIANVNERVDGLDTRVANAADAAANAQSLAEANGRRIDILDPDAVDSSWSSWSPVGVVTGTVALVSTAVFGIAVNRRMHAMDQRIDRNERAINAVLGVTAAMAQHGTMHIGNFAARAAQFGIGAPHAVAAVIQGMIQNGDINHNDQVGAVAGQVQQALQDHPW